MRRELQRLQVGSRLDTLAAEDNRAEMARNLANATQTADNAKANVAAMVATRDAFIHQWEADISQQLSDATGKLSDARQALRAAEVHSKMVELHADSDATVLSVAKVSVGSVMQVGQQLITLMPAGSPLDVQGPYHERPGWFRACRGPGRDQVRHVPVFPLRHGLWYCHQPRRRHILSRRPAGGDGLRRAVAGYYGIHERLIIRLWSGSIVWRCAMCRPASMSRPA